MLECSIFLNEFEDDKELYSLPCCSHVYHLDCIDIWFNSHVTCLVYRANHVEQPMTTLICSHPYYKHDTHDNLDM
ncbi:hypothetical protein B296_00009960 [Ensete ventricosum]|uniref:RING-type E3 ubiquitin transferase n=1 Tax=Ensete ventricosum TaxID=4639 RepID=A0A427AYF5_ENSVE|nr:hypothetical protein B296_00009960 [Ensete ventricosum]